ncbi:TPA: SGNH/GDSL hydrolase family protein [Pseudomonas aeruginosa]
MSKVKRLNFTVDQFESVVPYASEHGQYVRYADYAKLEAEAQALREEVAALRARVVVLPEPLNEGDARRECREYGAAMRRGYNACLRELARLNGMTVSESALDTLRRFATGKVMHLNNGLCPDDIEGHEARDPDCPVCRALIETGKESDNV